MRATTAGFYHLPKWGKGYPALQVLTIADLMHNRLQVQMPPVYQTFKQAQCVAFMVTHAQSALFEASNDALIKDK